MDKLPTHSGMALGQVLGNKTDLVTVLRVHSIISKDGCHQFCFPLPICAYHSFIE